MFLRHHLVPTALALILITTLRLPAQATYPNTGDLAPVAQPYVDQGMIPGALMMVANKDKILDVESVGYANVAAKKPFAPDTLFAIASMSKPIAATALMILVDEGKVSVDDPVEKYLPEFANAMYIAEKAPDHILLKKPTRPILIRDLLTHTSGLPYSSHVETPDLPKAQADDYPLDALPLEFRVRSYAMTPLNYDPGTKQNYASAGINTVARIVEVVSGMPYDQFLQQRIFDPLGMKDTTFFPSDEQMARAATIYNTGPNRNQLNEESQVKRFTYPLSDRTKRYVVPGSGLFSTALDMMKFCQMYLNGGTLNGVTILSPASVQAATTTQTPPNRAIFKLVYGFGWATDNGYSHGGSFNTFMHVWPKDGLITMIMMQVEGAMDKREKAMNPHVQQVALAKFKQS